MDETDETVEVAMKVIGLTLLSCVVVVNFSRGILSADRWLECTSKAIRARLSWCFITWIIAAAFPSSNSREINEGLVQHYPYYNSPCPCSRAAENSERLHPRIKWIWSFGIGSVVWGPLCCELGQPYHSILFCALWLSVSGLPALRFTCSRPCFHHQGLCFFCNELLVVNDYFKVQGHEKQRKVVL